MRRLILILFCGLLCAGVAAAQDAMPDETAAEEGPEEIVEEQDQVVGWTVYSRNLYLIRVKHRRASVTED